MNVELLGALARIRRDQLLAESLAYRNLRANAPRRRLGMRGRIARVVRALGYAALALGDTLAESR